MSVRNRVIVGVVNLPWRKGKTVFSADEQYLTQWEKQNNFKLTFLFNGGGSEDWKSDNNTTTDPLVNAFVADQSSYNFVNHTYDHPLMGCVQNTTVVPWTCETDSTIASSMLPARDRA